MNKSTRLAVATAALILIAGCHSMRHKAKPPREPVLLPGAPSLEPGPASSPVPGMSGQTTLSPYSPLSTTAPVSSPSPPTAPVTTPANR
ncbi:MAG: hypothetical protein ACP5XB_13410 [Isosphaeraceae bacterium]